MVEGLRTRWNLLYHQAFTVKSHRKLGDAQDVQDLYVILGNTAADETAKLVNKRDMEPLLEAADQILRHGQPNSLFTQSLCIFGRT